MLHDPTIDVLEDDIEKTDRSLLAILLTGRTTRKNILWGTDDYLALGEDYGADKAEVFTLSWVRDNQNNLIDLKFLQLKKYTLYFTKLHLRSCVGRIIEKWKNICMCSDRPKRQLKINVK